tara:strand:+ start:1626 stop:1907 length:282 start_codon:yes stop_codon:yes gene_type:complete
MFKPCNRYLLVRKQYFEEEDSVLSTIELPEGSYKPENRYEKVTVAAISSDVRPPLAVGKEIVVLSHMIEEVDFGQGTIYLVLENHVLGVVEDN